MKDQYWIYDFWNDDVYQQSMEGIIDLIKNGNPIYIPSIDLDKTKIYEERKCREIKKMIKLFNEIKQLD